MELYYAQNDQQKGPVDLAEFNRLRSLGQIRPQTLVFTEGMSDWMPLERAEADGFVPAPPAAQPSADQVDAPPATLEATGDMVNCPTCGRPVDPSNLIPLGARQVCPACRDQTLQRMREGVSTATSEFNYAGFWIRFASSFIDGIIVQIYSFVIGILFGLSSMQSFGNSPADMNMAPLIVYYILVIGGPIAFVVFFLGHPKLQATPGMMATKLRIIRPDGDRVTYMRALGRTLASILSQLILYIGYFMLIWDDEKRTLHDRIADTRIIYR